MEKKDQFDEISNVKVLGNKSVVIEPRTVEPHEKKGEKGKTQAVQEGNAVVIQEITPPKVEVVISEEEKRKQYKNTNPAVVSEQQQPNGRVTKSVVIDPEAKK